MLFLSAFGHLPRGQKPQRHKEQGENAQVAESRVGGQGTETPPSPSPSTIPHGKPQRRWLRPWGRAGRPQPVTDAARQAWTASQQATRQLSEALRPRTPGLLRLARRQRETNKKQSPPVAELPDTLPDHSGIDVGAISAIGQRWDTSARHGDTSAALVWELQERLVAAERRIDRLRRGMVNQGRLRRDAESRLRRLDQLADSLLHQLIEQGVTSKKVDRQTVQAAIDAVCAAYGVSPSHSSRLARSAGNRGDTSPDVAEKEPAPGRVAASGKGGKVAMTGNQNAPRSEQPRAEVGQQTPMGTNQERRPRQQHDWTVVPAVGGMDQQAVAEIAAQVLGAVPDVTSKSYVYMILTVLGSHDKMVLKAIAREAEISSPMSQQRLRLAAQALCRMGIIVQHGDGSFALARRDGEAQAVSLAATQSRADQA